MAMTVHQAAAEDYARELLRRPGGAKAIADADEWRRANLGAPVYDAFGQPYRGSWTMGQTAVFAKLLLEYDLGHIRATHVEVGQRPASDRLREQNRAALANLPLDIRAEVFDGLSHDGDGNLHLPGDLIIVDTDADGRRVEIEPEVTGVIPLEIGYTEVSRTFMHLHEYRAVARWPYGHEKIIILSLTDAGAESWYRRPSVLREDEQHAA